MRMLRSVISACAVALTGCGGPAAGGQSAPVTDPTTTLTTTPLMVSAVNAPRRLSGSDGKVHLDYDLIFQSVFDAPVTITSIEVLDPDGNALLALRGDRVAEATMPVFPGPSTAVVPPGGALGTVLDVVLPSEEVPARLGHRIRYTTGDSPARSAMGGSEILGPELDVDPTAPAVIKPPVRGADWVNGNACCAPEAPHRHTRFAVGGTTVKNVEEFAVDLMRMPGGRALDGAGTRVEDFRTYGAEVLAVADGEVTAIVDDMPDQRPDGPRVGIETPADYAGNRVSLQISPGVWAIYGHLQPGSVTVEPGDQVRAGQVIGRLGNSGNSSAPHLHFQLSDGPDIMNSNSLPFSLDSYRLVGSIDPAQLNGDVPVITISGPGGEQTNSYPLAYTVSDFGQ